MNKTSNLILIFSNKDLTLLYKIVEDHIIYDISLINNDKELIFLTNKEIIIYHLTNKNIYEFSYIINNKSKYLYENYDKIYPYNKILS